MNPLHQGVIALLKAAITGQAVALPTEFDIEKAYPLLRSHSVTAMGYAGGLKCGLSKGLPTMQKLRQDYFSAMGKSQGQIDAVANLCRVFNDNGIDHMPLKGCIMKKLYPAHELRSMGDADILIRVEQYPRIREIMEALGYRMVMESDHELVWETDQLHLELHKRLIPSSSDAYFSYYGDGWQVAQPGEGNQYHMSDEDAFIYLLTHFAKHYEGNGIGSRHIADIWVYLKAYPHMDEAYLQKELTKLGLWEFYGNLRRTVLAWFEDGAHDEKTEWITNVIFAGGSWGSVRNGILSETVKGMQEKGSAKKGKWRWFIQLVFLPMEKMRFRYPVLQKCPILLPFCWVLRWFDILIHRRQNVGMNYKQLQNTSSSEIEAYAQSLEFVGLGFERTK